MKIFNNKSDLSNFAQSLRGRGGRISFVPTMGALHAGHLSLIELAKAHSDHVIVSVFVNPTQFAPHEDFDAYPRDVMRDADLLKGAGVCALYAPDEAAMYLQGDKSCAYETGEAAQGLETDFRPHFFGGVVNVVSRLFDHVRPDAAVFGEKDYQQLQVIREMVDRYEMPIEIIGAPIARDEEGLALSSRNAYLSRDQLAKARGLNKVLRSVSEDNLSEAEAANALLSPAYGFEKIDYITSRWGRVLGAAWLDGVRLIDNV